MPRALWLGQGVNVHTDKRSQTLTQDTGRRVGPGPLQRGQDGACHAGPRGRSSRRGVPGTQKGSGGEGAPGGEDVAPRNKRFREKTDEGPCWPVTSSDYDRVEEESCDSRCAPCLRNESDLLMKIKTHKGQDCNPCVGRKDSALQIDFLSPTEKF